MSSRLVAADRFECDPSPSGAGGFAEQNERRRRAELRLGAFDALVDGVRLCVVAKATAAAELADHNGRPDRSLRPVVGRLDASAGHEGKRVLLTAGEAFLQTRDPGIGTSSLREVAKPA